jgi:phasin
MFAKLKDWPYLNALRPLRPHVLQRYLHRGNRHLLARSMSPDPSNNFAAVVLLALTCLTDVVALPTARFHRSTSEGFFAPGIEPMEINMDPKLQVPEALRNLAETNVDQAEKAFNGFLEAARKSLDLMQSANMPSPIRDIPKRSLDLTEKNMKAAFEHARKLALAKDLQEVLQLQTEFLKSQFVAAQEQMKQLGSNLSAKAGEMTSTGKAEGDTSGAEASEATPSTRRTKGDTSRT